MVERLAELAAGMRAIRKEGGRTMWHLVLADTVLDMLKERDALTGDNLRQQLLARMESTNDKLLKDAILESIEQLAARRIPTS